MSEPELRLVIHGQMTSSNAFKAAVGSRMVKTKEAKEDARRVAEIAIVAVTAQGWEFPDAADVTITAYNSRLDADNVSKIPCDALKTLAWRDDADVMQITVRRRWDREGERYEVVVRECADERPNAKRSKPRRAFDDLPADGIVRDFAQRDAILRKAGVL